MATYNLTTYTEYDPNGYLVVDAAKVTAASRPDEDTSYVRKDYGANYYDALNFEFEGLQTTPHIDTSQAAMALTVDAETNKEGFGSTDLSLEARPIGSPLTPEAFWCGV